MAARVRGLSPNQRAVARVLMASFVAADESERATLDLAVDRLGDLLASLARPNAGRPLTLLLSALSWYARLRFGKRPQELTSADGDALLHTLCEQHETLAGGALERFNVWTGKWLPNLQDAARALREVLVLAYYSGSRGNEITGYVPVWERKHILDVAPETKPPPARFDVAEIRAKHVEHSCVPLDRIFSLNGRPRVAVIGSGAGGSVVAACLAQHCDVAVFEAGPRFAEHEYPLDTLAGMALLYRDGLMMFTRNMDVQLLAGRLVGGSTVLTSGMSVRPRKRTLEAWQRAGISLVAMEAGLTAVERRLRLEPLAEDLLTDLGRLWRGQGGRDSGELIFEMPLSNAAMSARQHLGARTSPRSRRGERCLACGLCNYGCRFGHKLSVDRTFLKDATRAGARVHPNLAVHSLSGTRDPKTGRVRATGLRFERDPEARPLPVDYVVLAAGALGSPHVLLRSVQRDAAFAALGSREQVGLHLGFNYGTGIVAEWSQEPDRPGDSGIQIHYMASKPEDESFVLENAFMPPALLSASVPGVGRAHREWMQNYRRLGLAVNTIGSPQTGRVRSDGSVDYAISGAELAVIHESLALLVQSYLRAGASRVGLSGLRGVDDSGALFCPREASSPRAILEKIRRVAPTPDRLMLTSAHLQGGMRLDRDPARGAVGPDFRVHGTENLMVADASLFPSTIVVNTQWTVMALAHVAAAGISEHIARDHGTFDGSAAQDLLVRPMVG